MGPLARVVLILAVVMALAEGRLPLALVGEQPLSSTRSLAEVPLILVPNQQLDLFSNVHISAVSRSEPLVTCRLNSYTLEATPAVRVVLRRPLIVQSPEAALPFPVALNVLHEGLRMSLPVGALIAPVHALSGPQIIRVMYAVPTSPLSLHYPYYSPYSPIPYPFRPAYSHSSSSISSPVARPELAQPVRPAPHPEPDNQITIKKPAPQLVTVLHFPEEIATPESLYYQPPVDDDELGNRNKPEAVVPAGIVQSSQPRPSLQLFINSKESPLLQSLRDEAQTRQREKSASSNSITVEAL